MSYTFTNARPIRRKKNIKKEASHGGIWELSYGCY